MGVLFYDDVAKLEVIERKVCDNLMTANHTRSVTEKELLSIAYNYRADMATMIGVLREYKQLVEVINERSESEPADKEPSGDVVLGNETGI